MIQWISKKMYKKRKGFTLIELVVVIAILGLLAALAIPRFSDQRKNATKATVLADARSIYSELEVKYAEDGKYPPSYSLPTNYTGNLKVAYATTNDDQNYSLTYQDSSDIYSIVVTDAGGLSIGSVSP